MRRAEKGEKFVTLDGQERTVDDSVLMICDANKAVGLAGIMGGENSMITDQVKTMLFEAACFDGTNIRLSSKKLGLRTDASAKFEKGLDPNTAQEAIDRACQLIEELGAGEVVGGIVDVYSKKREGCRIPFDADKINRMLGTEISEQFMKEVLKKIDLGFDEETQEVIVPSWRQDLESYADIAEEVARFYGYDNIPTTLPTGEATTGKLSFKLRIEQIARDVLESYGFHEGMTYSFESPKVFDKLLIAKDSKLRDAIRISNPLGEDFSIMRTLPLHGLLSSLSTNYNRRNKNVRLYEMANIYLPKQLPLTELPEERLQICAGMYGDGDFFDMKGVAEEFLEKIGMNKKLTYTPDCVHEFLHPGRKADLIYDKKVIGYMGEIHPAVAKNYSIGERVTIVVLDLPVLLTYANFDHKYEGIGKYPSVTRDISLTVPKEIMVGEIESIIEKKGGQYLKSFQLFDLYEGEQIEMGFKSVAYTITFCSKEKTLEEKDVSEPMERILKALEEKNIMLRK